MAAQAPAPSYLPRPIVIECTRQRDNGFNDWKSIAFDVTTGTLLTLTHATPGRDACDLARLTTAQRARNDGEDDRTCCGTLEPAGTAVWCADGVAYIDGQRYVDASERRFYRFDQYFRAFDIATMSPSRGTLTPLRTINFPSSRSVMVVRGARQGEWWAATTSHDDGIDLQLLQTMNENDLDSPPPRSTFPISSIPDQPNRGKNQTLIPCSCPGEGLQAFTLRTRSEPRQSYTVLRHIEISEATLALAASTEPLLIEPPPVDMTDLARFDRYIYQELKMRKLPREGVTITDTHLPVRQSRDDSHIVVSHDCFLDWSGETLRIMRASRNENDASLVTWSPHGESVHFARALLGAYTWVPELGSLLLALQLADPSSTETRRTVEVRVKHVTFWSAAGEVLRSGRCTPLTFRREIRTLCQLRALAASAVDDPTGGAPVAVMEARIVTSGWDCLPIEIFELVVGMLWDLYFFNEPLIFA